MAIPSQPRFNALMWGQGLGVFIVFAGVVFHWMEFDQAKLPLTIKLRVIGVALCLVVFTIIIPLLRNSKLAEDIGQAEEGVLRTSRADDIKWVQKILWRVSYLNLFLLTYLIHITGGITSSTYSGLYLLLPSVPMILRMTPKDTQKLRWFTVWCAAGIFLSFFMSHFDWVEYKTSDSLHAYDLGLAAVTLSGVLVLLFDIAIIRHQERKQASLDTQKPERI
jgi:hypothetical protein